MNMMLLLSEEDYTGWRTVYRGSFFSTWSDRHAVEDAMPMWLLEYLDKLNICYVLLPWPNDPDLLPEFCFIVQTPVTVTDLRALPKGPNTNLQPAGS